ncbi:hypothetical protein HYFRA_00013513 [Hymenoscyphus fraxineus]|uniref:SMP domain-containing protein n=1 Tax=Hymenoscyphus fraxineus TaxID=746836 RepID=A0A9N9PYR7_9HELO|nr:hypothetical protein HYFRA_00013513 [Hymenoscyphus fraxineus]
MPQMTKEDSSRIQSTQAKGGNDMTSTGFAARAQGAADRNTNAAATGGNNAQSGGKNSGAGTGGGEKK